MIDILIVGSGGAGLSVALEASKSNAKITVVSKTLLTASQTCQAQGGINASLDGSDKSINEHIDDTLRSGGKLANATTVKIMCQHSKETIQWLDKLAVPFSKDSKGQIAQRKLGGAKSSRACYSSDYTGLKILHTLFDTCLKNNIEFLEEYMLLSLIVEDDCVKGAVFLDIKTSKVIQILAKKVVLATGGYASIYTNHNTNSYATTGDGIAVAIEAKAKISNLEFVQFHPTALKENGVLISESARGEGGYLVTKDEKRFVDELKPRDVVARAIMKKILNNEDIFLDVRHLGQQKLKTTMPQEYNLTLQYAKLHMDKDLIPIKPVAHYSMGGIVADEFGHTNIQNLYAVGECANNGVHGANRLGGNSLLEIIVFGRITGKEIIKDLKDIEIKNKTYDTFTKYQHKIDMLFKIENKTNFYDIFNLLGTLMYEKVGLFKDEVTLQEALTQLQLWQKEIKDMGIIDKSKTYNTNLKEFLELQNMLCVAIEITKGAIKRKENCGAHFRVDCVDTKREMI